MHSDRYPTWSIPSDSLRRLSDVAGPDWEVESIPIVAKASGDGVETVPDEVLAAVADAEIYMGFGVPAVVLRRGPNLRWVHSAAAGVRSSLTAEMKASGVLFTNSAGVYGRPLAEWAIGAILYFARGFDLAAGPADPWPFDASACSSSPLREVGGSRVAVIGYGGIGREIGRLAAALGMNVTAVRARPDQPLPEEADRVFGTDRLPEAVSDAHYVVLALPETAGSVGLFGKEALAAMRSDAVLLNVARGSIVDEAALVAALRRGSLRGAALDVFRREPLPADSPLLELSNVLATPHTGSVSPRFWERQTALMAENLARFLRGETLVNLVDKHRGY
ncbi:MAG: D-2-hydroxyacid dehydrogenase [Gemmatimonadota bacterium]|nr:D-2-hydroxyacid dehydrogenase [Gemmatimonadota bacterium]MDH3426909.1 D-2-hydroxyacid dehydrogenase [Gemmatimonadota bacterium]